MIRRTKYTADLAGIRAVVDRVEPLLAKRGQLMIKSRPGRAEPLFDDLGWLPSGVKETDFSEINAEFAGTAIADLIGALPFPHGRARLMLMPPKSSLSIHADSGRRYHYAVVTAPDCYLVEMQGNQGIFHHVPADGHLYEMDAFLTHTALNTGKKPRIHIVISSAEVIDRPKNVAPVGRVHALPASTN